MSPMCSPRSIGKGAAVRDELGSGDGRPLALRPKDAADAIGISTRKLWELTNRGLIPHGRIGRAVIYRVADLEAWLAELTKDGGRR